MKTLQAKKPQNSIKSGDLFRLGDHFLLCGDSTDEVTVATLLSGHQIKLILTDPPYGVSYVAPSGKHDKIANDQLQSDEDYQKFTESWLSVVIPSLSPKNSYYIFNSDRMLFSLEDGLRAQGFKFSQLLIWVKTGATIGRLDYCPQHELIAYGWHGTHPSIRDKDKSVLIAPKPKKNTIHPTMKPVSLIRRLVLNSSNIGDIVYDPFGGSGSTLIACEQTKRKCISVSPL